MKRKGKILVVCDCILNANSKITPLANYEGVKEAFIIPHIKRGTGLLQLPCPETSYLGMKRWGMTRDQYDNPGYRKHCRKILETSIDQIEAYIAAGYSVEGVVGVNGSPSCGVTKTCTGFLGGEISSGENLENQLGSLKFIDGNGVFIEILKNMLAERGLSVDFTGIDET